MSRVFKPTLSQTGTRQTHIMVFTVPPDRTVLWFKYGVSATTPIGWCLCNYTYEDLLSCAVIQHKCTATLDLAESNPHCSVLLRKSSSQQGCVSAIIPMDTFCSHRCAMTQRCSTDLGRIYLPLFDAALQNRLPAVIASLQMYL